MIMSAQDRMKDRLRRIERDIVVEKQVRQQIADRGDSTAEIDQRINSLKSTASALREHLEKCQ
jgi:hypothetical protein